MITGANSGIGKCAAVAVAKRGKCLKSFSLETNLYFITVFLLWKYNMKNISYI